MSKIQQDKSNQQFILNSNPYHNNPGRNSNQFHYMSGPIQQHKYSENKIRRKNNILLENNKIQSQSMTHRRSKESVYRIPAEADYQRLQSKSTKETWYDMGEAEKMKDFELPCSDDNDNTMTKNIDEEDKFEFLWEDIDTTTTSTTTTTTAPVTLQYKRKSRRGKSIKNQSTHSALNLFKQLSRKMKRPPKRVFSPLTKSTKSLDSRKPPATSTIQPLIQTTTTRTTTTRKPSYASSSFVRIGSASSVYVSPPKFKKPSYVVDTGPGGVELLPSPSQMGETAYIKRNHYQSARFYPSRPHQTRHRNYTPRCSYSYIDPSHKCTNSYSNYGNHK